MNKSITFKKVALKIIIAAGHGFLQFKKKKCILIYIAQLEDMNSDSRSNFEDYWLLAVYSTVK